MTDSKIAVHVASIASRVLLVFVVYALLLVVSATLVGGGERVPATLQHPGSESLRGLSVVALLSAGLVSWFILRSSWAGARLAGGIALTFFGAHTLLPELEALAAPAWFSHRSGGALGSWLGGAVFAAALAGAAVLMLGATKREPVAPEGTSSGFGGVAKVAAAAVFYVVVHASLGCRMGWQPAPLGRTPDEMSSLLCPLPDAGGMWSYYGLELVRGVIWALIGLVLVRLLRGGAVEMSLAVGVFFALAAPVHQLLPSPLIRGDWAWGQHWVLGASQLACGAALARWLSWGGPAILAPRRGHLGAEHPPLPTQRSGPGARDLVR